MPPKGGKRDRKATTPADSMKQQTLHKYLGVEDMLAEKKDGYSDKYLINRQIKGEKKQASSKISQAAPNVYYGFTEDDQALLDEGELTEKELQVDFSDDELNMEITQEEKNRMTEQELEDYEKQKEQMDFANQLLALDTMQYIPESDMLNIKFDREEFANQLATLDTMQIIRESDLLNIKCDHEEFTNLCRLSEIGLLTSECECSHLGDVKLSELDLIFITDPECSYRDALFHSFSSKCFSGSQCVVDYDEVISLLHFIAQAPSNDPNIPSIHKRLFKASDNLLKSVKRVKYGTLEERQELCRINLELFCCSIIPRLDFTVWRSGSITSILRNLCQVYLDVVAVQLKDKLSTAFETIVNSLVHDKKDRVLNEFCVKLSKWNLKLSAFLSGMRNILAMLSCFKFFDAYKMRAAYYIFKAILSSTITAVKLSEKIDGTYSDGKHEITVVDTFNLLPNVVEVLAGKPTDLYITMQLLDTCTVDSALRDESLKTLITLQDRMNLARLLMVCFIVSLKISNPQYFFANKPSLIVGSRSVTIYDGKYLKVIWERWVENKMPRTRISIKGWKLLIRENKLFFLENNNHEFCDTPHRIQMVINAKRQEMVCNLDDTMSSDEDEEDEL